MPITTALSDGESVETLLSARRRSSNLPFEPDPFKDFPDRECPRRAVEVFVASRESFLGGDCIGGFEKSVTRLRPPHLVGVATLLVPCLSSCSRPSSAAITPGLRRLDSGVLALAPKFLISCGGDLDEVGEVGERTSSPMGEENGRRGRTGGCSGNLVGVAFFGFELELIIYVYSGAMRSSGLTALSALPLSIKRFRTHRDPVHDREARRLEKKLQNRIEG